ncbi:alpha-2-macroglobulin family protein [Chryseobacterium sp. 2R14A]|uniref:alpha-2-macroglobulin family protein n=1 Tax=Chryseobacterium sp. 2R14A TaxID=3380353 RepID=UPI003CE85FFB
MQRFSKVLFLILISLSFSNVFAQTNYDAQWKKIEENSRKGSYKSNLPVVLEIQKQAMKENNGVQLIRSLKAEFSLINQTTDDEKNDTVSKFFAKLSSAGKELKINDQLMYKALLSGFLMDYYNENSWKINGRTNINSQDLTQIETWSKLDFKNYLNPNFKDLDQQSQAMKKVSLAKYRDIFLNTTDISYFPTLFEWYSTEKISFLANNQLFTKSEIDENKVLINQIYNDLISSNDGNAKLYFSHQNINANCGRSACQDLLQQLQNLAKSDFGSDYKVLINQQIANILIQGNKQREALDVIENTKKQFPNSLYLNNLKNIENQIKNLFLNISYEQQTQPNLPIHISAEFKNVSSFSINIYKIERIDDLFYNLNTNSFDKIKKSLVRKDDFKLSDPKDYLQHRSSIEIKPLPPGIYIAEYFVENNNEKLNNQNFHFLVSENRIIYQTKSEKGNLYDRLKLVKSENGQTLDNEKLVIYEFSNDKKLSETKLNTDKNGTFNLPVTDNKEYYRNFVIYQPKSNSYQTMQVYGDNYRSQSSKFSDEETAQIFLDRKIYRPGQTVCFKVITTGINGETQKTKTLEKVPLNIILKDANDDEVQTQNLVTNEFGSAHGSFVLPKNKLNGTFWIEVNNDDDKSDYMIDSRTDFQVEEYKRPKFELTFEPIKDEYKYGETLQLKGKAMMFSGVALSNMTVHYEIKKQNIRWRYFSWFPRDYSAENSILGEVKTDAKGEFIINVDLKKDEKIKGIQIDNFSVNASVTDINGETQSANTDVKVASVTHYINADEVKSLFDDEPLKIKVETKNYNEQNLKKTYQVKLSKLKSPERIFRDQFKLQIQDLPQFSKTDFINKFPHDRFDKNDESTNPGVSSVILNDTKRSDELLNLGKLEEGNYKLELFNIEGKDTIATKKEFSVFSKKSLAKDQNVFLEVVQPKTKVIRGETAEIFVYSSIPNAVVNVFVQNGIDPVQTSIQKMTNGVLRFPFTAPSNEKISKMDFSFQIVAFNDVQTKTVNFDIVENKKDLKIETTTFRDKIEPNSKEKWSVKISGNEGEKINAEVLANMYDMSLDQFAKNSWNWQKFMNPYFSFNSYDLRNNLQQQYYNKNITYLKNYYVGAPKFNWFDQQIDMNFRAGDRPAPAAISALQGSAKGIVIRGLSSVSDSVNKKEIEEVVVLGYSAQKKKEDLEKIQVRQNLNETAFFYPDLKTDLEGNVNFEFTSPEALTKWKLMFLAHTKDARAATLEKEVVTQKEFSVTPNYPRFLREGDELNLQSKLSNLTNKKLNGSAQLQILDAFTNKDISEKFGLSTLTAVSGYNTEQAFSVDENANSVLAWKLKVPNNVSSIIVKVVAKAGQYSDGEQKAVAVLPNRMLVTESVPVFVKEGETKTFELENLKNATSTTISNVSNTLELTTNPIWEIMFALPSLKNDQNNSADVIFNKWFADVLASEIFKANPKMKTVFEQYQDAGLLNSNLEKNQELKQLLLDETPWVLESKSETEQMEKLALLFDTNTMKNSINQDWSDFSKLQNPDGGFSWYQGYPSSYGTSLYILKNLGKINAWLKDNVKDYQSSEQKELVKKLIGYVDNEINKYVDSKEKNIWTNWSLDYLDTRNYWEKEYPLKGKGATLKSLVKQKAKSAKLTDFTFFGLHRAALLMNDYGLKEVSDKLLNYLKETSVDSKTQGVYWKQNLDDWGWFSSKVVNHAGALEAFNKLKSKDQKFIEDMKIWLITQKEVNSWGSSRGTSEVIFMILNSGKSWANPESDKATIVWGGKELQSQTQATGYVKSAVKTDVLDRKLATVTVTKPGTGIVQGGLFWQYYEDLDKIKSSENYISVTKELYKKIKTVNGEELQKITSETLLKVGDKVTVRMILNTDRAMEFIHIKDMRAAGFEPLDVISGYQWKNNLGYYQSTKDASTNFYIQYMPKGKYVFEYDYMANASGKFSNGITTIQNYYAPQMNAHTKGTNVMISE